MNYTIRLQTPIWDVAHRRVVAESLALRLKLEPQRAEALLGKGGNLIKGVPHEQAQRIAQAFQDSGVTVDIVPLEQDSVLETSEPQIRASVPPLETITPRSTPVPSAPEVAPDAFGRKPKNWISLRWKLLALALAPLTVASGAWLISTITTQANENRLLLVQGAVQTASVFSKGILERMEAGGQTFEDAVLQAYVQQRTEDLVNSRLVPLDFAVVVNPSGEVVAAYDRTWNLERASEAALTDPVGTWRNANAEAVAAVRTMSLDTMKYRRSGDGDIVSLEPSDPLARLVSTSKNALMLAAYPLPGGAGATVLGLDGANLQARVNASALATLTKLIVVFLIAAALAAVFASSIIRRLVGLAQSADRISMGEIERPVEDTGKDEIGDLAESVERMRSSLEMTLSQNA
jgi:HAMP domain-containing protein